MKIDPEIFMICHKKTVIYYIFHTAKNFFTKNG